MVSSLIPPTGVAIALVGFAVENSVMTASGSAHLAAVVRGNDLMGTTTNAYTVRSQVTPPHLVPLGADAGTRTGLIAPGSAILVADGNGTNALWSIVADVTSPDAFTAYVEYIALDARELTCG